MNAYAIYNSEREHYRRMNMGMDMDMNMGIGMDITINGCKYVNSQEHFEKANNTLSLYIYINIL